MAPPPPEGDVLRRGEKYGRFDTVADNSTRLFGEIQGKEWMSPVVRAGDDVGLLDDEMNLLDVLLSYGAGWLVDNLRPIQAILDALAGQPGMIRDFAETWANVGDTLGEVRDALRDDVDVNVQEWTGGAADAYREFVVKQQLSLTALSVLARGVSLLVHLAAEAVAYVRGKVRALLADLVKRLVKWLISLGPIGFAASEEQRDEIAPDIEDTAEQVDELLRGLQLTTSGAVAEATLLSQLFEQCSAGFESLTGSSGADESDDPGDDDPGDDDPGDDDDTTDDEDDGDDSGDGEGGESEDEQHKIPRDPVGEPHKSDEKGKWLKKQGVDPHKVKDKIHGKPSRFDIYTDRDGNIWAVPKGQDPKKYPEYLGNLKDKDLRR